MEYNERNYYDNLPNRQMQLNVLDAWARDLASTEGASEEALQFWLEQMIASDALPSWWSEADLAYMRRRLGID